MFLGIYLTIFIQKNYGHKVSKILLLKDLKRFFIYAIIVVEQYKKYSIPDLIIVLNAYQKEVTDYYGIKQ